jgi:iron-sulfur cluster assembly accessory protein
MIIDRTQISLPEIKISAEALSQMQLMLEHDVTIENKVLRLQISGKGCHGFDYSIGFTEVLAEDILVQTQGLTFHFDPFSAYYMSQVELEYMRDEGDAEGFVVTNLTQDKFMGKFWRKSPDLVPPELTLENKGE